MEIVELINSLKDERRGVREFAAQQLVMAGSEAVPALIKEFASSDSNVLEGANAVLSSIGQAAIPFLIEAMKNPNRKISWGASLALNSIGWQARQALPPVTVTRTPPITVVPVDPPMVEVDRIADWSSSRWAKFETRIHVARRKQLPPPPQHRSVKRNTEVKNTLRMMRNPTTA